METGYGLGLAHIEVGERIGVGGFGAVYRGYNRQLNRQVAVKILNKVVDESARDQFDRECSIHGPLSNHANVTTIHSAGYTDEGRPYLEMELIEGGTLQDMLERSGRIGWQQAVDWLILICDAVQSAHDHGVLHRDIKPANILMAPEGPRLTDFGISCLSDATCPGQGWSLLHAPPELLDNRSDRRSDVYSLGSTLFTLIAGHAPFELPATDSTEAVLARLATAPPPRLPANLAPPWLDELLQLALAKDPGDRPQTVADLQSALEAGRGAGHQGTGDGEGRRPLLAIEEAAELRPLLAAAADRWTGIDGAGVPAPTPVHRRLPGRAVALGAAVLVALAGLAVVVVLDQGEGEGAGEAQHTFAPVEIGDDVVVSRRWRLAGGGTLLEAQLDVTNEGPSAFTGHHYEILPASVASDTSQLRFTPAPDDVVAGQPVARFAIDLSPGQRLSVVYEADLPAGEVSPERIHALAADQRMAEQAFLATTAEGLTVPLGPGAAPMTGGIDGTTVSEPTGSPTTRRPPATGPSTGPPPAPASVDASDGEDGASTVSWAAVGGDGVEYEVQLVEEPQRVRSAGAGTSLRWTGLSNGARYRFRVRAITASGTGRWSDASLAVTPTGPRPAIMVNRAEVAGSTVTVDFSTSACTVARLTGPGSGHAFPGWPNDGSQCRTSFSHTITGLAPATRYVFSIEVRDPPGPHRVVQTIRFATPPDPVPPTPEPPPPTPDPVPPTPEPPPPTPDPPPPTPEPPPPTPGGDDPPPPDGTDDDASPVTGPPNVLVVHSDAATDADAGPDG